MNFVNESEFNRWWSRCLRAAGAKVVAIVGTGVQEPGLPDRYVCHRRWRGWIEGKKDGGKLSTAQVIFLREMTQRGENVVVCHLLSEKKLMVIGDTKIAHSIDLSVNGITDRAYGNAMLDVLSQLENGYGL